MEQGNFFLFYHFIIVNLDDYTHLLLQKVDYYFIFDLQALLLSIDI